MTKLSIFISAAILICTAACGGGGGGNGQGGGGGSGAAGSGGGGGGTGEYVTSCDAEPDGSPVCLEIHVTTQSDLQLFEGSCSANGQAVVVDQCPSSNLFGTCTTGPSGMKGQPGYAAEVVSYYYDDGSNTLDDITQACAVEMGTWKAAP